MRMKVVCAQCGALVRGEADAEETSHALCDGCVDAYRQELLMVKKCPTTAFVYNTNPSLNVGGAFGVS